MSNIYTMPDRRRRAIPEVGGSPLRDAPSASLFRVDFIRRTWGLV